MRQVFSVTAIGIAAGLGLTRPSWSQVCIFRSEAHDVRSGVACDAHDSGFRNVVVTTVPAGIWKGFMLFKMSCGRGTGELFFNRHSNLLRYVIGRGSQRAFDAASIPTSVRSKMFRILLERMFEVAGRRPVYFFATSSFPEIGARLAAAAAESSSWDREAGRPRNVTINDFARRLMNEKQTYPELANVLDSLGYSLQVNATEEIIVLRVDRMSAEDKAFIKVPLLPSDKLPVSTATYFRIERR
jgi:hypothetical protein